MKSSSEVMSKLDQIARRNGNGYNKDIQNELESWEKEIRKDQMNKCAEALESVYMEDKWNAYALYCKGDKAIKNTAT